MSKVLTVAKYTFLEGIRAKIFIGAIAVSVVIVVIGAVLSYFPYGRGEHLIGRIGWGGIFLTGLAINLFYTITMLSQERDTRILNLVFSKPIGRTGYGLGKFLGLYTLMALAVFGEGLVVATLMSFLGEEPRHLLTDWLLPSIAVVMKCGVLVAMACFFATLLQSSLLAMSCTFVYYLVAVGAQDAIRLAQITKNTALEHVAKVLSWFAPQFAIIDLEGWIVYEIAHTPSVWFQSALYFGGYTILGLVFYVWLLERQELK